jgi:hypothetical protein
MHGSWGTPDPMVNMVVAVVPSPFPEVSSVGGLPPFLISPNEADQPGVRRRSQRQPSMPSSTRCRILGCTIRPPQRASSLLWFLDRRHPSIDPAVTSLGNTRFPPRPHGYCFASVLITHATSGRR